MSIFIYKNSIFACLMFICVLSGCKPQTSTSNSSPSNPHSEALKHIVRAGGFEYRGAGQASTAQHVSQADLEGAASEYRAALQLEPDNHQASLGLAEVLIKSNKAEEGIVILQALAKNQDDYARTAKRKLTKMGIPSTR